MFFILSKVMMFLIMPIVWIIGILMYSLFTKNSKRKRKSSIFAIILIFFFSNSFIIDEVFRAWEMPVLTYNQIQKPYDYGIVLGGMITHDSKNDRINVVRSFDRMLQTIELYKKNKLKRFFLTGGSGSIVEDKFYEAELLRNFLVRIGIPSEDILYESNSRNTRENAVYTAKIINQIDTSETKRCLLITSAFHMRRGLGCFRKVGLDITPFVADRYAGERKFVFDHLFIPNVVAIENWTLFLHEFTGYIVYAMMGYI